MSKKRHPSVKLVLKGLGAAGQARLKAAEVLSQFEIAGLCSRREEVGNRDWKSALQDASVEAVAISTENTDHEESVRQALQAGKHVLCDYPLAFSAQALEQLYRMAKERDLILHVEHIALLSKSHQWVKAQIREMGKLKKGLFKFTAAWSEKWADSSLQGDFVYSVESRLMQILDWFGGYSSLTARVDRIQNIFQAELGFADGARLSFEERREKGAQRSRELELEMEKGRIAWPQLKETGSLFGKDLECFYLRIREGKPAYYSEEAMKKIISALEALSVN